MISRFKYLMLIGVVVGAGLALLSVAHVTSKGLTYRQSATYLSYSRVFVTQTGFPWGRLGVEGIGNSAVPAGQGSQFADPSRLTSIAIIYANLADSDAVRRLMLQRGPIQGTVQAAPVLDPLNNQPLPLISIAAFSDSPAHAVELARRQTNALIEYVQQQQVQNSIPKSDRVSLVIVKEPGSIGDPKLAKGRSMTLPIIVFLTVMIAFCGLAFILENARPLARKERGPDVVSAPGREAA